MIILILAKSNKDILYDYISFISMTIFQKVHFYQTLLFHATIENTILEKAGLRFPDKKRLAYRNLVHVPKV